MHDVITPVWLSVCLSVLCNVDQRDRPVVSSTVTRLSLSMMRSHSSRFAYIITSVCMYVCESVCLSANERICTQEGADDNFDIPTGREESECLALAQCCAVLVDTVHNVVYCSMLYRPGY